VLGVSLSNRAFSSGFATALAEWMSFRSTHLEVVLFDTCETVNYRIFRGLDERSATALARSRGQELGQMFSKAARKQRAAISTALQSQYAPESRQRRARVYQQLLMGYLHRGLFYSDVRRQVLTNLSNRARTHSLGFLLDHMDALATYVLIELAFFYVQAQSAEAELYPGLQLFVKQRLFSGDYHQELDLLPPIHRPAFIDVSFLLRSTGRNAVQGQTPCGAAGVILGAETPNRPPSVS
jgi:tRNA-dependent cyclodipeptide synthase